jgi:putative acetyltransferase
MKGLDPVSIVRPEVASDHDAVRQVHSLAFAGPGEAALVDRLRGSSGSISLVATEAGRVVGHILFTAAMIKGPGAGVRVAGLGPMAVTPSRQRDGIGFELVLQGLEECGRGGFEAVVVVGHPLYYPRFGFHRGSTFGLRCRFDVPDEVFMAAEPRPGALTGGGEVRYAPEFSEAWAWGRHSAEQRHEAGGGHGRASPG